MDLHPLEAALIKAIREKYQWGSIEIECREGLPQRVGKTIVYEKLISTDY
jgi:hypothetical protein